MSRRAASLLLALALLAAGGQAWAKSADRGQPLDLNASSSDCSTGNDAAPCTFTGNVRIVQGSLDIRAARADVRRSGGDIRRVLLSGAPVTMQQQTDSGSTINARSNSVDYDLSADTVVFTGNAQIEQPGNSRISSERIVYNMKSGQVQSGGQGSGGVKVRFEPKKSPAAAPAADKKK